MYTPVYDWYSHTIFLLGIIPKNNNMETIMKYKGPSAPTMPLTHQAHFPLEYSNRGKCKGKALANAIGNT